MFQVKADPSKNLLRIVFGRQVGADEAKRCAEEVRGQLAQLQPGFRLLTDLSELDSMDVNCAPHIKRTMDYCNRKGVGTVARVIPDPRKDIGLNIMSLFHYRRGIPIATCKTLDEAEQMLAT